MPSCLPWLARQTADEHAGPSWRRATRPAPSGRSIQDHAAVLRLAALPAPVEQVDDGAGGDVPALEAIEARPRRLVGRQHEDLARELREGLQHFVVGEHMPNAFLHRQRQRQRVRDADVRIGRQPVRASCASARLPSSAIRKASRRGPAHRTPPTPAAPRVRASADGSTKKRWKSSNGQRR